MSARLELARVSTVDALAAALRTRILDGELEAGERLREVELAEAYGVARHSLRAALRALAGRGADHDRAQPRRARRRGSRRRTSPRCSSCAPRWSWRPPGSRSARNGGRLPKPVHDAVRLMAAVCAQPDPPWSAVVEAHDRVHGALVAAARYPRIERAYAALAGEMRLFVLQLKPALVARPHGGAPRAARSPTSRRTGPEPLRAHLAEGLATVTG